MKSSSRTNREREREREREKERNVSSETKVVQEWKDGIDNFNCFSFRGDPKRRHFRAYWNSYTREYYTYNLYLSWKTFRTMRIERGGQIPRIVACRRLACRLWRAHPNNLTRPIIRLLKSRSCPADRLACIINRPSIVPCSPLNTWNLARNTIDPDSKLHPRAACARRERERCEQARIPISSLLFEIKSRISFFNSEQNEGGNERVLFSSKNVIRIDSRENSVRDRFLRRKPSKPAKLI